VTASLQLMASSLSPGKGGYKGYIARRGGVLGGGEATMENGVLTIKIDKTEEAKETTIPVK
jgi:hypothetical protein